MDLIFSKKERKKLFDLQNKKFIQIYNKFTFLLLKLTYFTEFILICYKNYYFSIILIIQSKY